MQCKMVLHASIEMTCIFFCYRGKGSSLYTFVPFCFVLYTCIERIRVKNIMRKVENTGNHIVFKRRLFSVSPKLGNLWLRVFALQESPCFNDQWYNVFRKYCVGKPVNTPFPPMFSTIFKTRVLLMLG